MPCNQQQNNIDYKCYAFHCMKKMGIYYKYFQNGFTYFPFENQWLPIQNLSNESLLSAIADIDEKKPYLILFRKTIGLSDTIFRNRFMSYDFFHDIIYSESPSQFFIDECLKRPFVLLDVNQQLLRYFFYDLSYSFLLIESFRRCLLQ